MPCPFTMLSHDLHTNKPKNMNKEYLKNSSYDLVNRMIILKIDTRLTNGVKLYYDPKFGDSDFGASYSYDHFSPMSIIDFIKMK